MATLDGKSTAAAVLEKVDGLAGEVKTLREQNTTLREQMVSLKEKAAVPQYPAGFDPRVPFGQVGRSPGASDGYSVIRAARLATGMCSKEEAKYEHDIGLKLKKYYQDAGWKPSIYQGFNSFVVPYCTSHLPTESSEAEATVGELKSKMIAHGDKVDPEEMAWLQKKMGIRTKDLGTTSDAAGGVLVGFPTLMELVDIQRHVEAFARAGATEAALPANGRMQFPKLTGSTTAYWVGEGATITESTPATGYLDLQAKKLAIMVDLNNELVRFASITAEAMVRTDMAKVAALKSDLAMLEGTGGTQIKGLITYPSASSWTPGEDKLLTYTVTSNAIQISDAADMEALLPDTAGEPTAWIMRRQLWAKIANRRASAVSSADSAGPYLASITRSLQERQGYEWNGVPVVRTTQVSGTRDNGSRTYVLLGYFPDWIVGRFGVLEFLSSNVGDTQMLNDQTRLRCIQHIDAGPRHASSFVFADAINIA